jgi:hypothetical protein
VKMGGEIEVFVVDEVGEGFGFAWIWRLRRWI